MLRSAALVRAWVTMAWVGCLGCATAGDPACVTIPAFEGEWRTGAAPTVTLKVGADVAGQVWAAWDTNAIHLRYRIYDRSPLRNGGDDWQMLFKTGDSVDLQIGLDTDAAPGRTDPAPGDVRVLMARTRNGPVVVAYRYRLPGTETPVFFGSPMGRVDVDRVERLGDAAPQIQVLEDGYVFEVTLRWATLAGRSIVPRPGMAFRGDFGVLFSDPDGGITVERIYWSDRNTSVVADVPSEIRLVPAAWGKLVLGAPGL